MPVTFEGAKPQLPNDLVTVNPVKDRMNVFQRISGVKRAFPLSSLQCAACFKDVTSQTITLSKDGRWFAAFNPKQNEQRSFKWADCLAVCQGNSLV